MHHYLKSSIVLASLLFAACQTPSHAPRPYSAEQIRVAHPDGTLLRFQITQAGESIVQCMRFENGNADTVDVVSWQENDEGQRVGTPVSQTSKWSELRDHGAFNYATTKRERSNVTVPSGTYACWHYTVAGATETAPITHFHFADIKPGPPVLMTTVEGDAEMVRMELLEYRPGR